MPTIVGQASAYARRTVAIALCGVTLIVSLVLIERSVFGSYSLQASERVLEAHSITNKITLAHERLTLAANMAALTAEQGWIETYDANLAQAEKLISRALAMARPEIARKFETETKISHDKIVELDRRVFEAVRNNDLARAQSTIADPVYQYHKQIAADGTAGFVDTLITSVQADLRRIESIELASITAAIALSIIGAVLLWWRIDAALTQSEDVQSEAEKKIKRLAMHDTLTGLANRMAFHQGLRDAIDRANAVGSRLAVLMIDLDRFKPVNDRYGHLIGDLILKEVAVRLRKVCRNRELCGRFGGDEFIAIVEYETDDNIPRGLGQRIVAALSEPITVRGLSVEIGASVGIAIYPNDAMDGEELIGKADMALYRAKSDGRGAVCRFDKAMDSNRKKRGEIEAELSHAIKTRALLPFYQPIVSLATGALEGFEILARWHHPAKGLLMPDAFVPDAEMCGLANDLTLCLLQKACLDVRALPVSVPISINVSPQQIAGGQLTHRVLAVVSKTKFPPSRLEIELTEAALIHDLADARDAILTLKNLGIQVVLDDFGTGSSSLGHLTSLPFDKVKMDRSLVRAFHDSREAANTVKAIIGLGKSLNFPTVAKGVEAPRDAEALSALGCTLAQGFLYAKPVPGADLPEIVARFSTPDANSAVA